MTALDLIVVAYGDTCRYCTYVGIFDKKLFAEESIEDFSPEDQLGANRAKINKLWEDKARLEEFCLKWTEVPMYARAVRLHLGESLFMLDYDDTDGGDMTTGPSCCCIIPAGINPDIYVKRLFMVDRVIDHEDKDSGVECVLENQTTPNDPLKWDGKTRYNCFRGGVQSACWYDGRGTDEQGPTLRDISGRYGWFKAGGHGTNFLWTNRGPVAKWAVTTQGNAIHLTSEDAGHIVSIIAPVSEHELDHFRWIDVALKTGARSYPNSKKVISRGVELEVGISVFKYYAALRVEGKIIKIDPRTASKIAKSVTAMRKEQDAAKKITSKDSTAISEGEAAK